jgi:hypothetical protein
MAVAQNGYHLNQLQKSTEEDVADLKVSELRACLTYLGGT